MTAPQEEVNPSRRGKRDYTRRPGDLATLREVAAIVNEGNRRQKEYFDQCFNSFVEEYEAREARKTIVGKIKAFLSRKKETLPLGYIPPKAE
jgi:hypothetical protein